MTWRFAGVNFDQMHMNTNLGWVDDHPDAEIVGVCDEAPETSTGSLEQAVADFDLDDDAVFDDLDACLKTLDVDIVIGCPRNSLHADFVKRVAEYDVHVAIEKPLATSLADADRMIAAMEGGDERLFVNWPASWDPVRHTLKRLVSDGVVGQILEVQYYGGNAAAPPEGSWFYDPEEGGGSLMDYLGYGATFSTWFREGKLPETVTAETFTPDGADVDYQSATVCRYEEGLSTLQSTWRMLTNPWEVQPQPAKGYEIMGTDGAISNRERDCPIRVTTSERPEGYAVEVDELADRYRNLARYVVHCLENDASPEGPVDPVFCREAHRIVETAKRSARDGRRLELLE